MGFAAVCAHQVAGQLSTDVDAADAGGWLCELWVGLRECVYGCASEVELQGWSLSCEENWERL